MFLNNINICWSYFIFCLTSIISTFMLLGLSPVYLLIGWASYFVTGAFLGFLLSGHFTDELWIILLSALILGLILGFLATRLILLSTFFVVLILVSVFSCGLLVSFVPSLSNVTAGIISLILELVTGVICIKLQNLSYFSFHCFFAVHSARYKFYFSF